MADAEARGRACASECRKVLQKVIRGQGVEANVSHLPPLVPGYPPIVMTCPHGVIWYAEPTSDQRAEWAAEGVE